MLSSKNPGVDILSKVPTYLFCIVTLNKTVHILSFFFFDYFKIPSLFFFYKDL